MNRISSSKSLLIIIAILLITNISMLVYILTKKDQPERGQRKRYDMSEFFRKDLQFTDAQMAELENAKQQHKDSIGSYFKLLNESKERFFNLLSTPSVDSVLYDSLVLSVATRQVDVEKAFFRHFRGLRKICRPEQQVTYDSLFPNEIRKMIGGRHKKHD